MPVTFVVDISRTKEEKSVAAWTVSVKCPQIATRAAVLAALKEHLNGEDVPLALDDLLKDSVLQVVFQGNGRVSLDEVESLSYSSSFGRWTYRGAAVSVQIRSRFFPVVCVLCAKDFEKDAFVSVLQDSDRSLLLKHVDPYGMTIQCLAADQQARKHTLLIATLGTTQGPIEVSCGIARLLSQFHVDVLAMSGICGSTVQNYQAGAVIAACSVMYPESGRIVRPEGLPPVFEFRDKDVSYISLEHCLPDVMEHFRIWNKSYSPAVIEGRYLTFNQVRDDLNMPYRQYVRSVLWVFATRGG